MQDLRIHSIQENKNNSIMIGMVKSILIGSWQLVTSNKLRRALHEASVDTLIGAIIMFPLSVAIIKACIDYAGTSSEMAAFINFLGLTGIAIVRKALVRLRFENKYSKN